MRYETLKPCTLLSPVPAVLVSVCGPQPGDKPNLITVAWAGTVNSEPPMVSVSVRKQRYSHDLIADSGEFVVNLVDERHCEALDFCGVRSGRDVDKFAAMRLEPMEAVGMRHAPAVRGLPGYLSCRVRQILPLGSHDLFLGEVVGVQVRDDLMREDGSLHLEEAGLVSYSHGVYQRTADVLGFFGYSVARPEVRKRRMASYRRGR